MINRNFLKMNHNDEYLLTVDRYVVISILPVLAIGFLFNPLVFYILTRPKFLKESMFRYFITTEIVDSIMLLFWLVGVVKSFFSFLTFPEKVTCKLTQYISGAMLLWYQLLSTLISIDRLMAIKHENNFQFRNTLKFQMMSIILLLIVSASSTVPFYVLSDLNNSSHCVIDDNEAAFSIYLSGTICFNAIPFLIRLASTLLIVNYLVQTKRRTNQAQINYNREYSFLKSVLTMDIWFFFCYMPAVVFNLIVHLYSINLNTNPLWLLVHDVFILLPIMQASGNFFVFLFCNKLFRAEFKSIIKSCFFRRKTIINRETFNFTP